MGRVGTLAPEVDLGVAVFIGCLGTRVGLRSVYRSVPASAMRWRRSSRRLIGRCRASAGSSSSTPRPRSACRRRRSARPTTACALPCAPAVRPGTSLATSASSSRSRFFVNTVGTHTGIVDPEADEPAEQQVVVELLHQLPLGADREKGLQQQGAAAAARAGSNARPNAE